MQSSPMLRRDALVRGSTHHSKLPLLGRQLLSQSRTLGKRSRHSFSVVAAANPIEKLKEGTEKVKETVTSTLSKATEAAPIPTPKPKKENPASSPIPKEKTVLLQGDFPLPPYIFGFEALTALIVILADDHCQKFHGEQFSSCSVARDRYQMHHM